MSLLIFTKEKCKVWWEGIYIQEILTLAKGNRLSRRLGLSQCLITTFKTRLSSQNRAQSLWENKSHRDCRQIPANNTKKCWHHKWSTFLHGYISNPQVKFSRVQAMSKERTRRKSPNQARKRNTEMKAQCGGYDVAHDFCCPKSWLAHFNKCSQTKLSDTRVNKMQAMLSKRNLFINIVLLWASVAQLQVEEHGLCRLGQWTEYKVWVCDFKRFLLNLCFRLRHTYTDTCEWK